MQRWRRKERVVDCRWSLRHGRDAMGKGTVESIHVASVAEGPPQSVAQAVAIPGAGLEGDRYALKLGTFFKPEPDHELTLIEVEAIEALRRDYRVELAVGETRRNIVTRNVPLNHLVGQEFAIGDVPLPGIRLCAPCTPIQEVKGMSAI